MAKTTLKCYGCKEDFLREEIINYCSPRAKTGHNYCPKCYKEKLAREEFYETVCKIFGLKAPGPRIWTDRERIQKKYGYTDETIIDCLKYIYEVQGIKKLTESLSLVTPINVDKMMAYKRAQNFRKNLFNEAMKNNYRYEKITVRENNDEEESDLYDLNVIARME